MKKIDKTAIDEIKNIHLDIILNNPYVGSSLKGKLSNIKSYHFKSNRVEYKIAYEVIENDKVIFHYMVSTRENFL